jgi:hypothetical protein
MHLFKFSALATKSCSRPQLTWELSAASSSCIKKDGCVSTIIQLLNAPSLFSIKGQYKEQFTRQAPFHDCKRARG